MSVSVAQISKFEFSYNGAPLVGGLLFTYASGTSTKLTTYQDYFGASPNTNPIVLDANGQCNLYLTDGLSYKLVLSPSTDTDPPTNPFWTVDNVLSSAGAANRVAAIIVDEGPFESGVGFIPGTTTTLPLSQAYGNPQNITVHFDGVYQGFDQYTLSGASIIFNAPIPVGVQTVYITGGQLTGSLDSPITVVDTISSLRNSSGAVLSEVIVAGYYTKGDGGGGIYYYDSTDTTSADNGGSIIVATGGYRWKLTQIEPQDIRQFGAKCNGTTDDSARVLACVNANLGKRIVHSKGTCLAGSILLSGSTYNGCEIVCTGGLFKLTPDGNNSNFDGGWAGIIVKDCDSVYLDLDWDGNQSAMTQTREQIYCVALAAATNTKIPRLRVQNIQGDGLCIGQSLYLSNTAPSAHVIIGTISGYNASNLGRNLLTILSVLGCSVDVIDSYQIGGTINSVREPGGLDIEPDFGYETCSDIVIGQINVTTAGTSGVAVLGKAVTNDATGDWNMSRVKIGNFNVVFSGNGPSSVNFNRGFDVVAKGSVAYSVALDTGNVGCNVDYQNRFKLDVTAYNTTSALVVGAVGNVVDFEINLQADAFTVAGLSSCSVTRGRFTGKVRGGTSTAYAIETTNQGRSSIVQSNVAYEIDAPYDGSVVGGFYNNTSNPVTYSLSYVRDCNFSNYPSFAVANNALLPFKNVYGVTNAASIPTTGSWHWQTFVTNDQPNSTGAKTTLGWARLNTGSNNVVGNDWVAVVGTNS